MIYKTYLSPGPSPMPRGEPCHFVIYIESINFTPHFHSFKWGRGAGRYRLVSIVYFMFLFFFGLSTMSYAFDINDLKVILKVHHRPDFPKPDTKRIPVTLVPEAGPGTFVASFGLPFPPDVLYDHTYIRILDEHNHPIPIFTRPLAQWWLKDHPASLRSVLVQFEIAFADTLPRTFTLAWDETRAHVRQQEVPLSETQFIRQDFDAAFLCPKVLPIVPPDWLCQSGIALQQVAASQNSVALWYDQHLIEQFPGSLTHINASEFHAHLYDRPATYAKIYIRHGTREHLLAALKASAVYRSHLTPEGFFALKPGDYKYVYAEGSMLLYFLTGDESFKEAALHTLSSWNTWNRIQYSGEGFWTERHTAFGMSAYLSAYQLTGDERFLLQAKTYFDGVYKLQIAPLNNKPPDGAWRHTAESHGDGHGWTTSPWMSALLMDSIWTYWILTNDSRASRSMAMYAKFIAQHAITPDGKSLYYMAASAGNGQSVNPENPPHHVEACYMLALGYYLSGDRDLFAKYNHLWPLVMNDGANSPSRKFSWRFRNTAMLVWFLSHAEDDDKNQFDHDHKKHHE